MPTNEQERHPGIERLKEILADLPGALPGGAMSEPDADRDPFELVAESFLARYRAGERPGIEEFAGATPSWPIRSGSWCRAW